MDDYDKVVDISWFIPDKPKEELLYAIFLDFFGLWI